MYGYYHAMPFTRGSAAIGRSLFAGVFSALIGFKVVFPTVDPDLMALTAGSPDEYRCEMLFSLTKQLPALRVASLDSSP